MERADRLTIAAGTPGFALMLSAGQAVARRQPTSSRKDRSWSSRDLEINGGDGFVAAAETGGAGPRGVRHPDVRARCSAGDAAPPRAAGSIRCCRSNPPAIGKPALIIDALFGAGLSRPVEGDARAMIEAINANGAPVLAVDLPSGVNGTTSAIMGVAVQAAETVTFFRKKPAHLLLPGRLQCGRVRVADIGIDSAVLTRSSATYENTPQVWRTSFPVPKIASHKYARGHVLAVSGEIASTGAARLSARAALRAGAGLVTLASPRDALAVNATGADRRDGSPRRHRGRVRRTLGRTSASIPS